MGRTAIVLGATGLTGGLLVDSLLSNDHYSKIIVFVRSQFNLSHPKLIIEQINLLNLLDYKERFIGDVLFCCIGTTKAKTPDENLYRQIDYGIPTNAAKICEMNGIPSFMVMSSMGANVKSSVFYSKLKGEMEQAVLNRGIKNIYILRPSLINGNRKEFRFFEMIAKIAMKVLNVFLVGSLKKYRSIKAETIVNAMIAIDLKGSSIKIIESEDIKKIAHNA
jgi:uncharacterized protein YbjT (DUF2867 family)